MCKLKMEIKLWRARPMFLLLMLYQVGLMSCTECYSCVNISAPADCHNIQRCTTEQCFITKIEYLTGEVHYTLGCANHNIRECSDYLLPGTNGPYAPNSHSTVSVNSGTSTASSTISPLSTLQSATLKTNPTSFWTTNSSISTETVVQTNNVTMLTHTTPSSAVKVTHTSTTQIPSYQSSSISNITTVSSTSSTDNDPKTSLYFTRNSSQYSATPGTKNNSSHPSTITTVISTYTTNTRFSSTLTNSAVSTESTSAMLANVTILAASTSQETKDSLSTLTLSVSATPLPISTPTDNSKLLSSTTQITPALKTNFVTPNHAATTENSRTSSVLNVTFSTSTVSNTTSPSKRLTANSPAIIYSSTSLASLAPSTPGYTSKSFSTPATAFSSIHKGSVTNSQSLETTLPITTSPVHPINSTGTFSSVPPSLPQTTTSSTKVVPSSISSSISSKLNTTETTTSLSNSTTYTPTTQSTRFYSKISLGTSRVSSANFTNTSSSLTSFITSQSPKISTSASSTISNKSPSTSAKTSTTLSSVKTPIPSLPSTIGSSVNSSLYSRTLAAHSASRTYSHYSSERNTTSPSSHVTTDSFVVKSSAIPPGTSPTPALVMTSTSQLNSSLAHTGSYTSASSLNLLVNSTLSPGSTDLSNLITFSKSLPLEQNTLTSNLTASSTGSLEISTAPSTKNSTTQPASKTLSGLAVTSNIHSVSSQSLSVLAYTAKTTFPHNLENISTVWTNKTTNSPIKSTHYSSQVSHYTTTKSLSTASGRNSTSSKQSLSSTNSLKPTLLSTTSFYQSLKSQTSPALSMSSSTPNTTSVSHSKSDSTFLIIPTLPINYSRSRMPSSNVTGFSPAFSIPTPPAISSDFMNIPFPTHTSGLFTTLKPESVNGSSLQFGSVTAGNITIPLHSSAHILSRNPTEVFPSRSDEGMNSLKNENQRKRDANEVHRVTTLCCDELGCNKHLFETCKDVNVGCGLLKEDFDICSKPQEAQKICRKTCDLCDYADGNWSDWNQWSVCSVTCGNGKQLRSRSCTNPAPTHGGRNCSGDSVESRDCQTTKCPADGSWSTWGPWSTCSVTCGYGLRRRYRPCSNPKPDPSGMFCIGDSRDDEICKISNHCSEALPVAQWEKWSSWTSCIGSCSLGIKYRQRNCSTFGDIGMSCKGSSTESDLCLSQKQNCEGIWMPWSTWSECSSTCGYGTNTRLRNCTGYSCQGVSSDKQICYNTKCDDLDSAFFATGPSTDGGKTGTIILQQVKTNVGGDYDVTTGTFVCRIPGFYRFFVHIEKQPSVAEAYCHINLNQEQTVSVSALADFGSIGDDIEASNTAVLHLEKGDVVRLDGCTKALTFTNSTSFSGMLLTPD